jgi:hypothetical protein
MSRARRPASLKYRGEHRVAVPGKMVDAHIAVYSDEFRNRRIPQPPPRADLATVRQVQKAAVEEAAPSWELWGAKIPLLRK